MKNLIGGMVAALVAAWLWVGLKDEHTAYAAWQREPVDGTFPLTDYTNAALTVGNQKREWVVDQPCDLSTIRINSGGAGVGAGNSTIDIMVNGSSIYATNAKPTIPTASTGDWTVLPPDAGKGALKAGDIIEWRVTGIPATSGHTRTALTIETNRT